MNFNPVANKYNAYGVNQISASEILLSLMNIQDGEDVLDVGCGTGNLIKKLSEKTSGKVVGIDVSNKMLDQAKLHLKDTSVLLIKKGAEDIDELSEYDWIVSNSSFYYFKTPKKCLSKIHSALKRNGSIAIQMQACICKQFLQALANLKKDKAITDIFSTFSFPVLLIPEIKEFTNLLESARFKILHAEKKTIISSHTLEGAIGVFDTGPGVSYYSQQGYKHSIDENYLQRFKALFQEGLGQQEKDGKIELHSERIFIIARKINEV